HKAHRSGNSVTIGEKVYVTLHTNLQQIRSGTEYQVPGRGEAYSRILTKRHIRTYQGVGRQVTAQHALNSIKSRLCLMSAFCLVHCVIHKPAKCVSDSCSVARFFS